MTKYSAIILAAGQGTRMKSSLPKVLHRIGGRCLVRHVLTALSPLELDKVVVVLAPNMAEAAKEVAPNQIAYQEKALGTGHAVLSAADHFIGDESDPADIFVLFGDTPFIATGTIQQMIERRREDDDPAIIVLGMRPPSPKGYGRFVLDYDGYVERIVEERDATDEERAIGLCNGGVMLLDGKVIWSWLKELKPNNAKGEYYLTDLISIAVKNERKVAYLEVEETEVLGINDRAELARAEGIFQQRKRNEILSAGVTMLDPESVYFSADTEIGQDCMIGPHVFFGPGVKLHARVEIRAFSHLEGVEVKGGALIGPFARLRPYSVIEADAHIGNFVEVKNTTIEEGAKTNHLSYLGDAHIGARANIGAGTITCNYDGFTKSKTEIGAGAFIGSNSALVAPVKIGPGAIIGAGSVITQDVPADDLALARAKQENKPGWAAKFRQWRKK